MASRKQEDIKRQLAKKQVEEGRTLLEKGSTLSTHRLAGKSAPDPEDIQGLLFLLEQRRKKRKIGLKGLFGGDD